MYTATGTPVQSQTQRIMEEMTSRQQQATGAGGATTYEALQRADKIWKGIREMPTGDAAGPAPQFVREVSQPLGVVPGYDVVVCGGTLGILAATALQKKGLKVAVIEQGLLRGREQEWNVSRSEMNELVELGLLSTEQIEEAIVVEFNPMRCGFGSGPDVNVRDVLNLGVAPNKLLAMLRARFEELGGTVLERTGLQGVEVCTDGVRLPISGENGSEVTARLVVDCMGFGSPIVRQVRWGKKPDGVCMVVGTMASGFPAESNTSGDLIYTCSPMFEDSSGTLQGQYFWEAFPASSGPTDRTTYMFTYLDASPHRQSLEEMFEDYWKLMPGYQNVRLEDLEVQRCLFGFFPTFKDSPLAPSFDRVLQIGDASGIQSPLSFGGFGAMIRHLGRISDGVSGALAAEALDAKALQGLNPYMPNLSGAWLFQKAMSVSLGENPDRNFINELMTTNFKVMEGLGEPVLKPFLQDVVQFGPLFRTLAGMILGDPLFGVAVLLQVGPLAVLEWTRHFIALGMYDLLHKVARAPLESSAELPWLSARQRFLLQCKVKEWEYGSGNDYVLPSTSPSEP
jgi:flavin-dependent dehydrogenase